MNFIKTMFSRQQPTDSSAITLAILYKSESKHYVNMVQWDDGLTTLQQYVSNLMPEVEVISVTGIYQDISLAFKDVKVEDFLFDNYILTKLQDV